jgi:uncharacterized protein
MNRWVRRGLVLAGFAALAIAAGSWILASMLVSPANHPVTMPAGLPFATVSIPGDGHAIAGSWRDIGADSPVVLLIHGMRGDRVSTVPRALALTRTGFSVLLIDLQAHGETPDEHITLGWRESADVRAAREWIHAQAPGRRVGVVGVSLGGASVLLGSQPARFDAVVLEAVYPRLRRAVGNRINLRLRPLGTVLAPLLLAQVKPRLGVAVEDLEPIRHIAALGAPVLVVGGSLDAHTTEEETRDLHAAAAEPRELWIVEGAAHQDFSRFDAAGYEARVIGFLRRNLAPSDR